MDEDKFLEEHPSLKGMIFKPTGIVYNRNKPIVEIDKVHETQIDKKKIEEVIESEDILKRIRVRWMKQSEEIGFNSHDDSFKDGYTFFIKELKKELSR